MPEDRRSENAGFYEGLPAHPDFQSLADPSVYAPVPDGWWLGLADIVGSTQAIAAGRYKEVNTAAAAVIAAVSNALAPRAVPFVFGGDGANFAVAPEDAGVARDALSAVAAWIAENFGLTMRVAMVPVEAMRAEGHDLCLARFAVSQDLSYAMFSGGGLAFAEARMKAGDFALPAAPPGARADLTGLSCRFSEIPSRQGVILSLIVLPAKGMAAPAFGGIVARLLAVLSAEKSGAHPIPAGGPALGYTRRGFLSEVRTAGAKSGRSLLGSMVPVALRSAFAYVLFATGRGAGAFDPKRYLEELVRNSDFRKFDDGLRMTLDCTKETADLLERFLREASEDGDILYGTHRQSAALMTCFVPVASRSDHVHFVDGASGGYAMAAQSMKRRSADETRNTRALAPPAVMAATVVRPANVRAAL